MLPLILLALGGCDFSAATDVVGVDSSGDTGGRSDAGGTGGAGADGSDGSGGGGADGDDPVDPATTDDDGDGLSEAEGDCDDGDPTVRPGQDDACNARDDDCDGAVDEDAWRDDPYEPNDTTAWPGGSWQDDGSHALDGTLHDDADIDRYRFSMEDLGWTLFRVEVGLTGIPDGAVYAVSLENVTTGDTHGAEQGGGALSLVATDAAFYDQSGVWEVAVWALSGADCGRPYLLNVTFSE